MDSMNRVWLSSYPEDDFLGCGSPLHAIRKSLQDFYQGHVLAEDREDMGIQYAFLGVFPAMSSTTAVDYVRYRLDSPSISEENAIRYRKTRTASLRAVLRKTARDRKGIVSVEDDEVKIGDIIVPCKDTPTFIVGGHERTIVPQLQRSPGVFIEQFDDGKSSAATIMPKSGSWLLLRKDAMKSPVGDYGLVRNRVDMSNPQWTFAASKQGKTLPLAVLLVASGFSPLLLSVKLPPDHHVFHLRFATNGATKVGGPHPGGTGETDWDRWSVFDLCNGFLAKDHYGRGGSVLVGRIGDRVDYDFIRRCRKHGVRSVSMVDAYKSGISSLFVEFCACRQAMTQGDAVMSVYRSLVRGRTGFDLKEAAMGFYNAFFNPRTFIMSDEGRSQIESILDVSPANETDEESAVTQDMLADVVSAMEQGETTDAYSLDNRRLRLPGELLRECLEDGLKEAVHQARSKFEDEDYAEVSGMREIWNQRYVSTSMDKFAKSELCQLVDKHNPLAAVTHSMRFSALGAGGILGGSSSQGRRTSMMKLRAPEGARHVHDSHYGRLSLMGPEGANVGLVGPLAVNAAVDGLGFMTYPVRKVVDRAVTDEVEHLSTPKEKNAVIAFGDEKLTWKGKIANDLVYARMRTGNRYSTAEVDAAKVTHMDMSPAQFLSLESSLVPFLAHDDATRAAIASSQMRQAVPLVKPDAPIVGTGWEKHAAATSNAFIAASRAGRVAYVDAKRVVVMLDSLEELDAYEIPSSLDEEMCNRWRPVVSHNDKIRKGQVLVESCSSASGELVLGSNVKAAFLPWNGYNFEDAIVVSERLVESDSFTSLHVVNLTCKVKETPFGEEELTDDLPDVAQSKLSHLDGNGIVAIGSRIKEGDILVGKMTPRDPSLSARLSPEDKLIGAVTGYWSIPGKNTSLRAPNGCSGTVVDVEVLLSNEDSGDIPSTETNAVTEYENDLQAGIAIMCECFSKHLDRKMLGATAISREGRKIKPKKISKGMLMGRYAWSYRTTDASLNGQLERTQAFMENELEKVEHAVEERRAASEKGVALDSNVLKEIRVKVACRRRLQVGDKLAGRHGNKGVVSIVVPVEDMPYDKETGEHVDMLLNPLGVVSRMNIGQVLEMHLGSALDGISAKVSDLLEDKNERRARKKLSSLLHKVRKDIDASDVSLWETAQAIVDKGLRCAVPPFGKTKEKTIKKLLAVAGLDPSGKRTMVDGRTGIDFDMPVTAGVMYMMKLHHMANTKMHARSTGPYSRITQQPTQGSALRGGQRLGEMEVWALMAYGAAYNLREMLTVKSDHAEGRKKVFDAIIETGQPPKMADIGLGDTLMTESAQVLFHELRALGLSLELESPEPPEAPTKAERAAAELDDMFQNSDGNQWEDEDDDW